ncbi:glycosyltransferase family 39 protein [Clostridium rectalis]|uniref:glycosyltransferase family 39 protein n=1 Tax=Clostridium rectalis TaxID=2040295 RepID=UPI000F62F224|nr:glycosyltransferase family 39 protein [Clostridium rectalis]
MEIQSGFFKKLSIKMKDRIYFSLITILAILCRIFFILKIPCNPLSDFEKYQSIATNIFLGNGHFYLEKPTAFQPMGYPFALGYFYRLIGSNDIFFGKLFNVIISSVTLIIILLILLKLCKSVKKVYLPYIIIAFIPNYIAYNNVLGSEVLITFLFACIIYFQLCTFNYKIRYIVIGIFIGLAALTKPFFLCYPIIIAVIMWLKHKNIKEAGKLFNISFIFMCIVVLPWTYRNYKKFNLIIPVSHNGGYVLFINNNSNNKNGAWMAIKDIDVSLDFKEKLINNNFAYKDSTKNEIDQVMLSPALDKIFKKEGKKWIKNHPIQFLKLGLIRIKNTFFNGAGDIYAWGMNSIEENKYTSFLKSEFLRKAFSKEIYIISLISFIFIFLNIKDIITSVFKKGKKIDYLVSIPVINISFFILISFVFEGQQRYNFPVLFLLALSSLICIEKIFMKVYYLFQRKEFINEAK